MKEGEKSLLKHSLKCFHYKKYRFKSYPIHAMSLSQAEPGEGYPIQFLCRKSFVVVETFYPI